MWEDSLVETTREVPGSGVGRSQVLQEQGLLRDTQVLGVKRRKPEPSLSPPDIKRGSAPPSF